MDEEKGDRNDAEEDDYQTENSFRDEPQHEKWGSGVRSKEIRSSGALEYWTKRLSHLPVVVHHAQSSPKSLPGTAETRAPPGNKNPGQIVYPFWGNPKPCRPILHYSSAPLLRDADPPARQISALLVLHH